MKYRKKLVIVDAVQYTGEEEHVARRREYEEEKLQELLNRRDIL